MMLLTIYKKQVFFVLILKLQLPVSRSWSFGFAVPKLELGNQKNRLKAVRHRVNFVCAPFFNPLVK